MGEGGIFRPTGEKGDCRAQLLANGAAGRREFRQAREGQDVVRGGVEFGDGGGAERQPTFQHNTARDTNPAAPGVIANQGEATGFFEAGKVAGFRQLAGFFGVVHGAK
jgi:hypothetical protein